MSRVVALALSAVLIIGYLLAVFVTRDVWAPREATRVTLTATLADGSTPSPEAMTTARDVVVASLGNDAEITTDGATVVATYPGREFSDDALREMFGPGDAKTVYFRPVIHAMPVASPPPHPAPPASKVTPEVIADEKELRQSTEQQIQLLALQFQATRCGQTDALSGHDDPNLPRITCSSDGKMVYVLDKSIIGGEQVQRASSSLDNKRGEYVVDLKFDDSAAGTWENYTANNIGAQTAFTIETEVISAPQIMEAMPNGKVQITGQFDAESSRQLADAINRGASPVSLMFESSNDETLPATTRIKVARAVIVGTGIGVAALVIGGAVLFRRRS